MRCIMFLCVVGYYRPIIVGQGISEGCQERKIRLWQCHTDLTTLTVHSRRYCRAQGLCLNGCGGQGNVGCLQRGWYGTALYNGTLREQVEWYGSLSGQTPSNQDRACFRLSLLSTIARRAKTNAPANSLLFRLQTNPTTIANRQSTESTYDPGDPRKRREVASPQNRR